MTGPPIVIVTGHRSRQCGWQNDYVGATLMQVLFDHFGVGSRFLRLTLGIHDRIIGLD
ncbi:MAG: hypothetical protein ACJ04O_05495 [Cellvibrionales bacterium]